MPKVPVTSSALSLQNVNQVLESVLQLTPPEKLLLYLKLPTGQPAANPLKSPVNPLGSRFEIMQTVNWVRTHFVEDKNVSLPKQNIYAEYLEYCSLNSMKPLSTADFGKVMKQVFPEVRPRRLGTRGNSRYCYSGLGKSRSLSCPYLPEDLGEEVEIKVEQNDTKPSVALHVAEEKLEKRLSCTYEPGDIDICESDSPLNGFPLDSTKQTGVFGSDVSGREGETLVSPVSAKNNSGTRRRKQPGPTCEKKDKSETKRRKPLKKSSAAEEITNRCTKDEKSTSICDIEHFSSVKGRSLTSSYNKVDLDISSDLNGGKSGESFSKINRSYSTELPAHNACRTTLRTMSVDVISDYDVISTNLDTVCNPFGENLPVNNPLNLQDSGISSTQEPPSSIGAANLQKKSDIAPVPDLNAFVVSSQNLESKLPLPRLRPVAISAPNQVAKIIILPSNVIKQTSVWPQRQYKPIQPRPKNDTMNKSFGILENKIDPSQSEQEKLASKNEQPKKDVCFSYESLPKLDSLGKDALDTYLNGEGNSQELDEELLQYFKPDFPSSEMSQLSDQVMSINHNDGLLVDEKVLNTDNTLNKVTIANRTGTKIPTMCKSSLPFYQSVSVNEVYQLSSRCITEFQIANGSDLLLPSPSGSIVLKRQASFDSGVRDLETPLNIPPSPNTRCKLFNFTPISPRPSSPLNGMRDNSKSSCDTSIQSPFISPRSTPNCARSSFMVTEIQPSNNAPPKQHPARLRSASTSCKSNSLIGNPSPVARKTQDLPSFKDLVKMSKPKSMNNHVLHIKSEPSICKPLLPPISPLSTPDSPVFSFSEVRKDSPLTVDSKLFPASGISNGHQNVSNDFSSQEVRQYFSKDTCFNFDFFKNTNRSKSVPVKKMVSKNFLNLLGDQATDNDNSVVLSVNDAEILTEKPFLSDVKSPEIVESGDDNLDKMLTYYKEDSELGKTNKMYLDVLNGESSFNSGDSIPLCNDNDPIVSSCASSSGNEQFISRRRDMNSLQSFLQSDQIPTPLDCLLGDVDIGLNGLSTDAMDVFSPSLPPIPTD